SWRLQHLRTLWDAQDHPVDLYSNGVLPKELQKLPRPPIIDPDLIGPDDFRNPVAKSVPNTPDTAFDLWLKRRHWVDAQIKALSANTTLVKTQTAPHVAAMFDAVSQPVARLNAGPFVFDLPLPPRPPTGGDATWQMIPHPEAGGVDAAVKVHPHLQAVP